MGYSKTTFRLDNSLKRLAVVTESSSIYGYSLLQQKDTNEYQLSDEAQRAQSGKQQSSLHSPLPMESGETTFQAWGVTMYTECCQQGKLT